jgi:hypothetical protein
MARSRVLIEEYHLSFLVPAKVPETEAAAIRRALGSRAFRAELLRVVREVVASRPDLRRVAVTLTR